MPCIGRCRSVVLLTLLLVAPSSAWAQPGDSLRAPTPSDLLTYEKPDELTLSPDGDTVLLRTRRGDIENNAYTSTTWLLPTTPNDDPTEIEVPTDAQSFEWGPDGDRIAYLARADRGRQVWIRDLDRDTARQVTQRPGGVRSFALSPDGRHLAYTAMKRARPPTSGSTDQRGVEIDLRAFDVRGLMGDDVSTRSRTRPPTQLWIRPLTATSPTAVAPDISVDDYAWSPSGDRIALTGVPTDRRAEQAPGIPVKRTDLYVYYRDGDRLQTIHTGRQDTTRYYEGTITYTDPFWSPSGDRLGFLRTDETDRWSAVAELGVHDLDRAETRTLTSADQRELSAATFDWMRPETITVEHTHRARRGLFRVAVADGTVSPVHAPDAYASGFSFSADGDRAAWVQQSVGQPPEVYTARRPFTDRQQLSALNTHLEEVWLPRAESVTWTSDDGTEVQGWLVRPREAAQTGPAPLLVLLHAGPGWPVTNRFDPHREAGWFYPVQVFAARGYAVLIPNYRGTDSFGKAFQEPDSMDGEPVADVLSGIDRLVADGIADPDRIGLMGHSHGAWLGPHVAAERSGVQVASFAEGMGNYLSQYGQRPGWMQHALYDEYIGASAYAHPERYAELSPAFRNAFTETTPTLFEYGENGTALQGLETARALWHHDTPHAFVVYRDVGHGITEPAVHAESMTRNLRWFERWMPADQPRTSSADQ